MGIEILIAVNNELRPNQIISPSVIVEQLFMSVSIHGGITCHLTGIYLPPSSDNFRCESHTVSID